MLQANEIRIGNYVKWKFNDKILQVGGIYYDECLLKISSLNTNFHHRLSHEVSKFDGVPITANLLERLGFVYQIGVYSKNGVDLYVNELHIICPLGSKEVNLKYIHQLQNLYFAINNEELVMQ